MLKQTEIERERYEARRKAQLDHNREIRVAQLEGEKKGRAEGQIGVIQFCERLLQRPETPREQLESLPLEELTRLAEDLQAQALTRR